MTKLNGLMTCKVEKNKEISTKVKKKKKQSKAQSEGADPF